MQAEVLLASESGGVWPTYMGEAIDAIAFFASNRKTINATGETSIDMALYSINDVPMIGAQIAGMWYLIPLGDRDRRSAEKYGPFTEATDALLHLKLMGTLADSL